MEHFIVLLLMKEENQIKNVYCTKKIKIIDYVSEISTTIPISYSVIHNKEITKKLF